jgi:hypothetical protein
MARNKKRSVIREALDAYNATKGVFGDLATSGDYQGGFNKEAGLADQAATAAGVDPTLEYDSYDMQSAETQKANGYNPDTQAARAAQATGLSDQSSAAASRTTEQRHIDGQRARAAKYATMTGYGDKVSEINKELSTLEANAMQKEAAGLSIAAAREQAAERAVRKEADAGVANAARYGDQVTAASGDINTLAQELRTRTDLTPEERQNALAAMNQSYAPDSAARMAGDAMRPVGLEESVKTQNLLETRAREVMAAKGREFGAKKDWKGLAEFFTNNDNYDNNLSYRFLKEDPNGNPIFGEFDDKDTLIRQATFSKDPAQLSARIGQLIDPKNAEKYITASKAAELADAKIEETKAQAEQRKALAGRTRALGNGTAAPAVNNKAVAAEYKKMENGIYGIKDISGKSKSALTALANSLVDGGKVNSANEAIAFASDLVAKHNGDEKAILAEINTMLAPPPPKKQEAAAPPPPASRAAPPGMAAVAAVPPEVRALSNNQFAGVKPRIMTPEETNGLAGFRF